MYSKYVKRALDFLFALITGLVFLPFMLIIIVAIRIDSPGSPLFTQDRAGRDRRIFKMYKFRTMRSDAPGDVPTHMLTSPEAYITRVGKFLRRFSIDEAPQVFNILKGDMSFVGPRPALWNQDDLLARRDEYKANGALPGLTGWAQVNGRDELPISVKARYDGEYCAKVSFLFDLKILCITLLRVLDAKGMAEGGKEE